MIGAGSIGTGWAVLFAATGLQVRLQDIGTPGGLTAARDEAAARLGDLAAHGLVDRTRGRGHAARHREQRPGAGGGPGPARHVQECVPEQLELSGACSRRLDELAPAGIARSPAPPRSSPPRRLGEGPARARALPGRPSGNPPYLLRVAELVPAPFTAPEPSPRRRPAARAGIVPIRVRREVEGFVFNRLQGALLREAYAGPRRRRLRGRHRSSGA